MKSSKLIMLLLATTFNLKNVTAQQLATNANVNIVTANNGQVVVGALLNLTVSITNTGFNPILANRVRPSISIPIAIASAAANALQTGLPAGWVVTANTGSNITFCNGTDVIPVGVTRNIVIKIQGNATGGPSTIGANLQFGPGSAVCTGLGTLNGDNPADNTSSTTVTVSAAPVPVTLLNFYAKVNNCKPLLKWTTTTEINTERFEIERSNASGNEFKYVANVQANGNSNVNIDYSFYDELINDFSTKVFYRLKIIDYDGSFKYSSILPVLYDCDNANVLVYPNPVLDGKLIVNLNGIEGAVYASLYSTAGQLVLKSKINNGINSLNVTNITEGIYFLNLKNSNGFNKNIKVIIK